MKRIQIIFLLTFVVSFSRAQVLINEYSAANFDSYLDNYNENKAKFSKAVKSGTFPKEANPYYIQKLQELDLNSKAQKFKSIVSQKYVEMNVLENPDPNAFDKFYNDELTKFVQENNLGLFSPEKLEQGFFTKTSGTRNSLFNTHVQSQMGKI